MLPDGSARGWFQMLLPAAERAGPLLSLIMAVLLASSLYWGTGVLRECVDRNRALAAQLVTQQQAFHAEMRLLVGCARGMQP